MAKKKTLFDTLPNFNSPLSEFMGLMKMISPSDLNQLINERRNYQGDIDFFMNYVAPKYHFDRTCNILYRMLMIMNKGIGYPFIDFQQDFIKALNLHLRNLWGEAILFEPSPHDSGKLIEIPEVNMKEDHPREIREDLDENGDVIYY